MRKRLLWAALFAVLCAPFVCSAEEASQTSTSSEESGGNLGLKWANFGLLAIGLGYLLVKQAPSFFNSRTDQIQKAIKDATGLKVNADFRASEVDRKMATLGSEIEKLRAESKTEMEAEHQRLKRDTEFAVARINQRVVQEVASLRHNASQDLRRHVTDLAISMTASRLRDHLSADDQTHLIHSFADRVREGTM